MSTVRREVTGRRIGTPVSDTDKLPALTALELEKHISVPEAARIKGISPDTFRRHYGYLIRKISPRRNTVKLRDLLSEGNAA